MILRTACAAALAFGAAACTSSTGGTGGSSQAGPTQPAPTSSAPTSSAPLSTAPTVSSAPLSATGTPPRSSPRPSSSVYTPPPPVGCAQLPRSLGAFHRGGALPSGVPVPQAVPSVVCTGSSGAVAAVWRNVSPESYQQELIGTGWTVSGRTYRKPHAPRTITVISVRGALVAVYRAA